MRKLLRKYFQKYKFKHPKTEDFIQLATEISGALHRTVQGGEDLNPFFSQILFGTGVCDYEVASIENTPLKKEDKQQIYQSKILLKRLGEIKIPVEVLIEMEDGDKIKKTWDGKERWHKLELETKSKIKSTTIDPENKIVLDIDVNNNSLTKKSQDSVILKLGSQYLFWMETFVQWITSF